VEGAQVIRLAALLLCGACAASAPPVAASAPARSKSCLAPEFRQLDFWLGDWDVDVHARSSPTSDQWGDARGHQHVEAILGGCAIAEHFTADGPPSPWAGASYSSWQPQLSQWRQTWVDDSGGYIALRGSFAHGEMTLYGEPRDNHGKQTQMRMVYSAITPTSLHWEWQFTDDNWTTFAPTIKIDYRRAPR
jgi:hypothetical protein